MVGKIRVAALPTARSGGPTPPLVRVPEATNGKPDLLAVVLRAHVRVDAEEVPVVRIDAAVLRTTPEKGVVVGVVVIANVKAVARWQHGKAVFVRAVAIIVPTTLGLELCSGDILTADSREQSFPFRVAGQVPAFGTNAENRFLCRARYGVPVALVAIDA